jgi:hypothetical protein
MLVGEHQRGAEFSGEGQNKVAQGDCPMAAENLGGPGDGHGEAFLEVADQVNSMALPKRSLQRVIISAAKPDDCDLSGVWGHGPGLAALVGVSGRGAALYHLGLM